MVNSQITCIHTNTYLVYSKKSKMAAIIDVAGPIDSLLSLVSEKNLQVKYFLFTHSHFDHVMGLPELKKQFPDARICISKQAYEDMLIQKEWGIQNFGQEWVETMQKDPGTKKMFNFNPDTFNKPDILLEDNQILEFGSLKICAIFTPGHSRGHMCFSINGALFSGDVLFYRSAGHTGWLGGSEEELIKSIHRLYNSHPDETTVYPGHGPVTDIGSEKRENKKVRFEVASGKN